MQRLKFSSPLKVREDAKLSPLKRSISAPQSVRNRLDASECLDSFKRSKVNKILCLHRQKNNDEFYFMIPYYMRLKIKDINKVAYRESTAALNGTLIINIDITYLPDDIVKKIKSKLVLQINRCEQVEILKSNDIEITEPREYISTPTGKREKRQLKITIRKEFNVTVEKQYSNIFFSPYEELVIIATFTLNNIVWERANKKIKISFNSMTFEMDDLIQSQSQRSDGNIGTLQEQKLRPFLKEIELENVNIKELKISGQQINEIINSRVEFFEKLFLRDQHSLSLQLYLKSMRLEFDQATSGDYQFSTLKFGVEDSNKGFHSAHLTCCEGRSTKGSKREKCKESDITKFREECYDKSGTPKKVEPFKQYHQHTHFCVTLYKSPFPDIFTILLPNLFLGIISFCIFYLKLNLIERTDIIATLLLGFIQLIPSIKEQLIDSTKITLLQFFTCLSTCLCFISFYDSFTRVKSDEIIEPSSNAQRYTFNQLWLTNGWFTLSFIVNVIIFVIILFSFGYFFYYEKKYLLRPSYYKGNKQSIIWKKVQEKLKVFSNLIWSKRNDKTYRVEEKIKNLREYNDYTILKQFFRIPEHYESRYSKFWCNHRLDLQLIGKYEKENKIFYAEYEKELFDQMMI